MGIFRGFSRRHPNSNISLFSEELQKHLETIAELQELNVNYRTKLEDKDGQLDQQKSEIAELKTLMEQQQKNFDIDRVAMQHELGELKRKLIDQRTKFDSMEEQSRLVSTAYKEICVTVESLGKDLANERTKSSTLEAQIQKLKLEKDSAIELQVIISDLQSEKALLEMELAKMVDNRFATQRDDEFQAEILDLKTQINNLEIALKASESEKQKLQQSFFDNSVILASAKNEAQTQEAKALELQHQLEVLQAQLQKINKDKENEPTANDIEEAFALLRLKREAGLNFEFLSNWQQMELDHRAIQDLRRQYAECVQELEKTVLMLDLEHKINDERKIEISRLEEKIKRIQNEYGTDCCDKS